MPAADATAMFDRLHADKAQIPMKKEAMVEDYYNRILPKSDQRKATKKNGDNTRCADADAFERLTRQRPKQEREKSLPPQETKSLVLTVQDDPSHRGVQLYEVHKEKTRLKEEKKAAK